MSTTPQMNPSSMSQQYGQQQYAQQQHGQQQPFGRLQGASTSPPPQGQQMSQQPLQQLQQLGQQQPYQQLLQQLGQQSQQQSQQQGQGQPLILPSAIDSQAITSGVAEHFWDVVTPLPGQPVILYLFIQGAWRQLVNPNQITHDEVQEAFAFGQQVIGFWDTNNAGVLAAIVVNK
ncbi:hypothetical protein OG735_08230 [Streptomyces sp. NBC_01210]|uniref:hypothetical protein n=1 Tax=Streptomyces sp. NBC_01210 TaxID=2903774 RepID=UPI002E11C7DC|nr:hypothetical protein OG735_08230 [Streptomyces sp. NBC_01210]